MKCNRPPIEKGGNRTDYEQKAEQVSVFLYAPPHIVIKYKLYTPVEGNHG